MHKNIKLTIDIVGLIVSITGILLLFLNEQFVAASALVVVSVGLIIYAIKISGHDYKIVRKTD